LGKAFKHLENSIFLVINKFYHASKSQTAILFNVFYEWNRLEIIWRRLIHYSVWEQSLFDNSIDLHITKTNKARV